MAVNLQVNQTLGTAAQFVKDGNGRASSLSLSTDNVGIGTPAPTQRLSLGAGNVLLPTANGGVDGNLYLGGITDVGQIGLRLFGGKINDQLQSGFIDVRAGTLTDGLIFRVDSFFGGAERMRITADGNTGIATATPREKLEVNGNILATGNVGIGAPNPQEKLVVEGNIFATGDIILNGADCAEDFDVEDAQTLEPGTVMIIGDGQRLHQSESAYDTRVAGVLSGAGDYRAGIILGKEQSQKNRRPLALTGKVFCKVDAQYSPIEAGDLLTTSPTPGHAMKASDALKAFGAVIGKALRPRTEGQGLIPILIALH
jgi:hypothetical protein